MTRTAMQEALEAAGYGTPRSRIESLLRGAIERHGSNKAACVAEVSRALQQSDIETMWEFFRPDRDVRLWAEVEGMIRQVRIERGLDAPRPVTKLQAGQLKTANQANAAAPAGDEAGSGQREPAQPGQDVIAAPVPPPDGSGQKILAQSGHPEVAASVPHHSPALLMIAKNSLLRSVTIDGRPIGECSAGRAREWSRARGRESRFAWLLAEGLPDSEIIGRWKNERDAEECARLAREAINGY